MSVVYRHLAVSALVLEVNAEWYSYMHLFRPFVFGSSAYRHSSRYFLRRLYEIVLQLLVLFFFFFQAEDGIRDLIVTGVQTCALPIWVAMAKGRLKFLCSPPDPGHDQASP